MRHIPLSRGHGLCRADCASDKYVCHNNNENKPDRSRDKFPDRHFLSPIFRMSSSRKRSLTANCRLAERTGNIHRILGARHQTVAHIHFQRLPGYSNNSVTGRVKQIVTVHCRLLPNMNIGWTLIDRFIATEDIGHDWISDYWYLCGPGIFHIYRNIIHEVVVWWQEQS